MTTFRTITRSFNHRVNPAPIKAENKLTCGTRIKLHIISFLAAVGLYTLASTFIVVLPRNQQCHKILSTARKSIIHSGNKTNRKFIGEFTYSETDNDQFLKAIKKGDLDLVKLMIKKGAKLDSENENAYINLYMTLDMKDQFARETNPLNYALALGQNEIADLLIQKGARKDIPNIHNKTADQVLQEQSQSNET